MYVLCMHISKRPFLFSRMVAKLIRIALFKIGNWVCVSILCKQCMVFLVTFEVNGYLCHWWLTRLLGLGWFVFSVLGGNGHNWDDLTQAKQRNGLGKITSADLLKFFRLLRMYRNLKYVACWLSILIYG